jgi:taurine transport system substrate-binding protein
MKSIFGSLLTAAFAGVLFSQPAAAAEKVVRVTNSPCICYLPMMVAVKKGWLADELGKIGTKLEVQTYQDGPSQIAALLTGSLDVAELGSSAAISLLSKGAPVRIIMVSDNEISTEGLVVKTSAGIADLASLKGKTIGVTAGSTSDYALRATLKTAGIDASDVKFLTVPPPAMGAAWKRGDIDAAYTWDPFLHQLEADQGKILDTIGGLSERTKGAYSIQNFYMATASYSQQNPDVLRAFATAISKAVDYIGKQKSEVANDFLQELGADSVSAAVSQIDGEQFYTIADQTSPQLMGTKDAPGAIVGVLQGVWQFNYENGKVSKAPDTAAIVQALDTSAFAPQ